MISTQRHADQSPQWPAEGRHILAHFDEQTIVVYQAYRASIAQYAVAHGHFGGEFSYARMSWIKPNFLWMMYRSGWGTKAGQEHTLGLRLRRSFFDCLLRQAISSSFDPRQFPDADAWRAALQPSDVRLQWDPDHDPAGTPLARRAIQLGLRGAVLEAFGTAELLEVIDMTAFVAEQEAHLTAGAATALMTPTERIYTPTDPAIANWLGLAAS